MGLTGKLICQTCIKTDGDVFHELFGAKPHHVHTMAPKHIQGCDLHEGEYGNVGSIVIWRYTLGKPKKLHARTIYIIYDLINPGECSLLEKLLIFP